jgi:aryl-alcohol dehydrogenase-like predicted oxidoreductase
MHFRTLGKTGLRVSEVGMGCNRLGEADQPEAYWVDLVQNAVELGVNLFDTSESYGKGRSEEILGLALQGAAGVVIATKASRTGPPEEPPFSPACLIQSVEGSLRRLHRETIDVFQLHSPRRHELEGMDWAEGMSTLKQQGKIRFRAVAVSSVQDGLWLIEQGLIDVLQITYNIFETGPEAELFERARQARVGLMCRMPLARGVLSGKFQLEEPIPPGHRALLNGDQALVDVRRAEMLRTLSETYPGGMTRLALHFSLSPQAISAIIPGARTRTQLEQNVAASNSRGLPPELRQAIRRVQNQWQEDE